MKKVSPHTHKKNSFEREKFRVNREKKSKLIYGETYRTVWKSNVMDRIRSIGKEDKKNPFFASHIYLWWFYTHNSMCDMLYFTIVRVLDSAPFLLLFYGQTDRRNIQKCDNHILHCTCRCVYVCVWMWFVACMCRMYSMLT